MNGTKQVRFTLDDENLANIPQRKQEPPQRHKALVDSLPRETRPETEDDSSEYSVEVLPTPRVPPPPAESPSRSLDLSVTDEPVLSRNLDKLSMASPKVNSVKLLQEEVLHLASRVCNASNSVS